MSAREPVVIADPRALQRVMKADFPVSDEQWEAVSAPLEPAVVVAGAGSGKTTLMAARVVYLVATGQVRPEQVLGLTFTTKAARELAVRVRDALAVAGYGAGPDVVRPASDDEAEVLEPTVATYNAYAAALLTEHGLRIGHEPDTRVMADASRYQLAERVVLRHRRPIELLSDHPATVVGNIVALEGALSEHLVTVPDVRAFHAREVPRFEASLATARAKKPIEEVLHAIRRREELLDLVEEYQALKARLGLMDFSDQIALTARLADEHPDVGRVERDKYAVVLLDEYQDTSVAQALLLSRLFSGPDAEHGRGHAVTAVGDPNQAIYGWRGASVSNILGFGEDFPAADGRTDVPTYTLTVNRRSDRRILAAANGLAGPLYAAYAGVRPLQPPSGAAEGTVRVAVHDTYDEELAWLADEVLATHGRGTAWAEIGVLTRDNKHAADVFDALTAREVPVEIVGLSGLLRLPEVAEVVATLTLLHDLTANAAALTLLMGPRWAIGPRDLAILGRRAHALAAGDDTGPRAAVADSLAAAVEGADPTELSSLCDALESPGEAPDYPYSPAARTRIGLLAGELRMLRTHVGEPLLDLVRRIVDTCGIDVELASATSPSAAARRDNLDLFVRAVADFQAIDGDVSLGALLAYLGAEDEMGTGLDVATPTEADSVKLLTVHRAKGLEWDVVFLVGVGEDKFPTKQTRTQWITGPAVLPSPLRGDARDVPQLTGYEKPELEALREAARAHEAMEELRLGYVAFTRARHELVASAYLWTETRASPVGPSPYLQPLVAVLEEADREPERWVERPEKGTPNPLKAERPPVPWPVTEHTTEAERRIAAAAVVRAEQRRLADGEAGPEDDADLDLVGIAEVAEWDDEIDRLLVEARRDSRPVLEVPVPSSLSATSLARLRDDPEVMAGELARPMPRPPSPAARFGTRFHGWVEARFGQQDLFAEEEVWGQGDADIDGDDDLAEVVAAFESGPFADRPPFATEAPFALVLAGQVVRGRIDAVYAEPAGSDADFLVVDWKTGRSGRADPMQLAVYRLAWAELHGLPPERVRAAFCWVRTGKVVEPRSLPDRAALERLVTDL